MAGGSEPGTVQGAEAKGHRVSCDLSILFLRGDQSLALFGLQLHLVIIFIVSNLIGSLVLPAS